MAKPEPWRLVPDIYPVTTTVQTRYRDLDIMGHVNNVALAGIFETARIHFHHHLGRHPQDSGVRWLIAAVNLNYLHETHFPADILIGSAIGAIGNTSWTVMSAAFQDGECVATCDTVVVTHGPEGRRKIDDVLRAAMEANFIRRD
jgi:acyl-CoA thioester hydrolase